MKLIVGLGNPGRTYAHNRHNIGFMCVSHLAKTYGISLNKKRGQARIGSGIIADNQVVLARPQAFMNAGGDSVSRLMNRFKVAASDLIVIHDDLDLPLGKIRIRLGGSSAGHKGLDSIITHIQNPDFYRVRVGIGRPPLPEGPAADREADVIAYVLSDFNAEEKDIIDGAIARVSQAIVCLLTEGITAAMNKYN